MAAAATAVSVELEVRVEGCIRGDDPRGGTPFFQGVWSLDTTFYFFS